MTGVNTSLTWTQCDDVAEVIAAESGHLVLETSPPDYVEKISRYLEFSEGQSRQEEVCHVPAEADSDSGDSLFITQRPAPKAVRSLRRRGFQLRSEDLEDLEDPEKSDSSSTSHDEESKPDREKRRRIKYNLPKYNFPFIAERKLKLRSTPLPDQNNSLLNYTIGGFFKCVRELRRNYQSGKDPKSSLPTVDMDGEDICPLSEEDEDWSEVEDIKVVEKKRLVVPLKAKSQQTWCNPSKLKRKACNARHEASQGGQTKLLSKVIPVTSVTESSDNDGKFLARSEVPNAEKDIVLFLQNTREEELDNDSDATVCEPRSTQKGREASTPVTEPQTDGCDETKVKMREGKEKDERHHESVEKGTGQNEEEPDDIQRREERDIPVSRLKKKKRERSMSATGSVGQEVDGSLKSEVRVEKKSSEDVELKSSGVTEPVNDDAEIQKKKKKKRKKEEGIVIPVKLEEEEAANRTVDLLQMSKEKVEESGNCLETSDSSYVKKKKHKKKKHKKKDQSSSNDAAQHGGEGVDVSLCLDHSVTSVKKKNICEWVNSSNTPKENEKVDETNEGLEGHSAELVTKKKKKKKKSETFSRDVSEDKVAQSDDSVSVREKEKKRTSSFLVADAEENDSQAEKPAVSAGEEELNDGVMKKKRKRKMSVAPESVEKYHEQSFEKPNKTFPETTDMEVKRKKKRTGSGSELVSPVERLESAADEGISPTGEAVVLKKKKCKDDPECPLTSTELVVLKKGKHGHSAEIYHDSSRASDRTSKETLNMAEHVSASPGNHLHDNRDKKRKKIKVLLEGNSLTESAQLEPREKRKDRNKQSPVTSIVSETSLSTFEMLSSDNMKNKHRKVKQRLYNPHEDFLSDS